MKTGAKKTLRFLTLFILLTVMFGVLYGAVSDMTAYADPAVDFDKTDVLEDLTDSVFDGVPFDVNNYPYDANGKIQVISLVEYCYSPYANMRDNYGLYIYVYNPALQDISEGSNKIEMAVTVDNSGRPSLYDKFALKLCSVSKGREANRFWKFKVVDREINGTHFADRVNQAERIYYIAGVEFFVYGNKTPEDCDVSRMFKFTGFATGYGDDSPLSSYTEENETLKLKLRHSSFIANVSQLGYGHYNQVNSVYFAVPDRVFEIYGNLQKILVEWYEYKLNPVVVTANENLYRDMTRNTGVDVGEYLYELGYYLWYGEHVVPGGSAGGYIRNYEWSHNIRQYHNTGYNYEDLVKSQVMSGMIPLVFNRQVDDPYQVFDFLNQRKTAGSVSSTDLLDAIYAYGNTLGRGYVDPQVKKISADLFSKDVDAGRTRGYQKKDIDFDDTFDLIHFGSGSKNSWFEKLVEFGFWSGWPDFGPDYENVSPIYTVQDTDLVDKNNNFYSDESISKRLLINESDVDAFKAYYNANKEGNRIILFRFGQTDYMARPAGYSAFDGSYSARESNTDTYVCSETVFLDFDIIQLTFRNEGNDFVIGVVSDPIDVAGSLTPPADSAFADKLERFGRNVKDFFDRIGDFFRNNWKKVLSVLGGLLGLGLVIGLVLLFALFRRNKSDVTVKLKQESLKSKSTLKKNGKKARQTRSARKRDTKGDKNR